MIAVALHDRLAVAAIRTSAIGLRMHVEQNVFHNGSSSMAASPNTDSKAIAAFVETPNFTKIESLRFLGRGLSSTLLFDFSNFGSGYQRLCLARVPRPSGCEVIVDNLDGLRHSDPCDSHLSFFLPWLERARFYHGRRSGLSQEFV